MAMSDARELAAGEKLVEWMNQLYEVEHK